MHLQGYAANMLVVAHASLLGDALGLSLVQLRAKSETKFGDGEDTMQPYEPSEQTIQSVGELDYVDWQTCGVSYHSNLGGLGPDAGEEGLRYFGVTERDGVSVDLVITNTSQYVPHDVDRNGLVKNNCFGVINLQSDTEGASCVDLTFELKVSGTDTPVAFDHHYFTVFDVDQSNTAMESVTFYDHVNDVYLEPDTVLQQSGALDVGLTFTSTTFGGGSNNPSNPLTMDQGHRQRSVTVDFVNRDSWHLTFCVQGGKRGRNFVFSGVSNLVTPAPTPSPTPTACQGDGCIVFEDPHVVVFDGQQMSLLGTRGVESSAGDMWLVKTSKVSIQARYVQGDAEPEQTFMGALAIGGPFLQGHRLIIGGLNATVTWDGEEILGEQSSEFSVEGLVSARRSLESCHVEAPGQAGAGIDLALPEGVFLVINRQGSYVNARIRMLETAGEQEGLCGNNNGDPSDDSFDTIMLERSPLVPEGQSLFDE